MFGLDRIEQFFGFPSSAINKMWVSIGLAEQIRDKLSKTDSCVCHDHASTCCINIKWRISYHKVSIGLWMDIHGMAGSVLIVWKF